MRIAMFGATGVVGSAVLQLAVDRGHDVRVLARSPQRVRPPDVDIVVGDVLDPDLVAKTLVGCAGVVSTLGGFGDAASIDAGTSNIMAAMREADIRRLVVMQGFHIPFPGDPRNPGARFIDAMLRLRSPSLVASSHRLGELLRSCEDLDWTLVRAPLVKPGPPTGQREHGLLRLGPRSHVTTGDLAEEILETLVRAGTLPRAPMVRST
jgi:putative NADH-flavin reductase